MTWCGVATRLDWGSVADWFAALGSIGAILAALALFWREGHRAELREIDEHNDLVTAFADILRDGIVRIHEAQTQCEAIMAKPDFALDPDYRLAPEVIVQALNRLNRKCEQFVSQVKTTDGRLFVLMMDAVDGTTAETPPRVSTVYTHMLYQYLGRVEGQRLALKDLQVEVAGRLKPQPRVFKFLKALPKPIYDPYRLR